MSDFCGMEGALHAVCIFCTPCESWMNCCWGHRSSFTKVTFLWDEHGICKQSAGQVHHPKLWFSAISNGSVCQETHIHTGCSRLNALKICCFNKVFHVSESRICGMHQTLCLCVKLMGMSTPQDGSDCSDNWFGWSNDLNHESTACAFCHGSTVCL